MTAREDTAVIRRELRRRGFTGSVRMARGTAYGWVEVAGSGRGGEFTPAERSLLVEIFQTSPAANYFVIAPWSDTGITRADALRLLGATS